MRKEKKDKPHSRLYWEVTDSPAFKSLSPHDVLAYLALIRGLLSFNNGDLSLTLSRAKECGIGHSVTLARSLRALCSVGLIAVTRRGGSTKGGQRMPTLYRVTNRPCFDMPAKHLEAMPETNEWQRVTSVQHGRFLIEEAEKEAREAAKKEGQK